MKILAIDPATACGWAHSNGASGVWDLSMRRDESSGMRLLRLQGKLAEINELVGVAVVYYEAARNAAPKMQGSLVVGAELQATIKLWCESNHVEFCGVSPSTIKKHATGKGNASKQKMIEAAEQKWPDISIQDDNQADALWILDYAKLMLGDEKRLPFSCFRGDAES